MDLDAHKAFSASSKAIYEPRHWILTFDIVQPWKAHVAPNVWLGIHAGLGSGCSLHRNVHRHA
eukprot:3975755-Amphidinium_carterae.1